MHIYKKWTPKPYSFLVNDANFVSYNPLRLRRNLSERTQKAIMATDKKDKRWKGAIQC